MAKNLSKFIGIGIVFVLLLIAGIFGISYTGTSQARSMGEQFVTHIHAKENDKAYALLHKKLQAKVARPAFDKMITDGGIDKVSAVSWNHWEVADRVQTVGGLNQDGTIEVTIKVTDIENDNKPGITLFNFAVAKK